MAAVRGAWLTPGLTEMASAAREVGRRTPRGAAAVDFAMERVRSTVREDWRRQRVKRSEVRRGRRSRKARPRRRGRASDAERLHDREK